MKKILAAFFITISIASHAQLNICGTDAVYYQQKLEQPELVAMEEESNAKTLEMIAEMMKNEQVMGKKADVMYIPIVFHVIHNNGTENITQSQIMDQIRVINEDFRKMVGTNGDKATNGKAVDMNIEFRLAQKDPNGNRHDGINRIQSTLTTEAYQSVKNLISWPSDKYLNIWVVRTIRNFTGADGTILGYAQFPNQMQSSNGRKTDGIVIRSDYTGTINSGNSTHAGRTLTHEIGHWIGLYHTFQDGCVGGSPNTCATQGDRVCDTPPVEDATNGCLTSRVSCNGQAMVENYMDYMDGRCANTFTAGQKERAWAQIKLYRSNIYTEENLAAAGILPDGSYQATQVGFYSAPYAFSFEVDNDKIEGYGWRVYNLQNANKGWNISSDAAFSANKSMALRNYDINNSVTLNSRDQFHSPEINLTTLSDPKLSFKIAYARMNTSTNDFLNVYISGDFGRTETRIFQGVANNIEREAGPTSANYIPAGNDWKTISVDLTPYRHMTNARIMFEFQNRKGNNIFIDDFYIGASTGVNETLKKDMAFNVYPNPMSEFATASFDVKKAQHVSIDVLDLLGRKIKNVQQGVLNAGLQSVSINKTGLTPGIYLINIETEEGAFSHKLVVN
jgi:hypothetical protein